MPAILLIMEVIFTTTTSTYSFTHNKGAINKYSTYLESELLELSAAAPIIQPKFYRGLVHLYWILWLWGILLILTTINHLFFPIGLPSSMPYHIGYWLWTCALGLFLSPFIIWGYPLLSSHIEAGLRPNLHLMCLGSSPFLANRFYYREFARGGTYSRSLSVFFEDLFCVTSFLRGFNALLNWVYQISYFGVRLWLVFVLHSFCIGCFGELFSVATDGLFLFSFPIGGFIGLGLPLSLLMILYLFIQIYVYISFSISFLFSTVMAWFRSDFQSFADFYGPSTWSSSSKFFLVPVSLVDFAPTHLLIYLSILLLTAFLSSRFWMFSSHFSTYSKLYSHISSN